MDEPCSALDPIATAKIEELIDELRGRYAIVMVTHNMQQAARVSQRTAFFHLGEAGRIRRTDGHLHQSSRGAHQGLYHRPLRLIGAIMATTSSGHTVKAFDEDIDRLRALIAQMGGLAEACHSTESMRCLVAARPATGAARSSRTTRSSMRSRSRSTSAQCGLIALRAPMADDLRDVVAALKMSAWSNGSATMPRTSPSAYRCSRSAPISSRFRCCRRWAEMATEMVHDVLNAFVERDAEAASRDRARQGGR